tara:strand:+ start:1429 stop:1815 length:387 start_codon:yes stop_codon:yes gene_type:complete
LVAPFSAYPDVGFIDKPIDTSAAQMLLSSLRQLRTELLNPSEHRGSINRDAALCQKVHDILVGQRVAQIPPHRAKDDLTRKPMMLEGRFAWHSDLKKDEDRQRAKLMQQSLLARIDGRGLKRDDLQTK